MPTGYTADVQSGKVTKFEDFALHCARAFGALIMMRDDSADAPIPDAFEPNEYYVTALAEAKAKVAKLEAMQLHEADEAAQQAYKEAKSEKAKWLATKNDERNRYEAMAVKVEAWTPPTTDHSGLKDFMLAQLRESISFDCDMSSYWNEPVLQTGGSWLAAALAKAKSDLAYAEKSLADERKRASERTAWVTDLKRSLKNNEQS